MSAEKQAAWPTLAELAKPEPGAAPPRRRRSTPKMTAQSLARLSEREFARITDAATSAQLRSWFGD